MAYFAIIDDATGGNIAGGGYLSFECDVKDGVPIGMPPRLTTAQLAAMGKVRVAVTGPLGENERWNSALRQKELIPAVPNAITPPVSASQAKTILTALLEDPPTALDPWTQLQRDQCLYLLLLGLFKDLKTGTVY